MGNCYSIDYIAQYHIHTDLTCFIEDFWLVGCFGFNGPFRQYFSLYRTVSQR